MGSYAQCFEWKSELKGLAVERHGDGESLSCL